MDDLRFAISGQLSAVSYLQSTISAKGGWAFGPEPVTQRARLIPAKDDRHLTLGAERTNPESQFEIDYSRFAIQWWALLGSNQ
jgi:hypothetical protein